MKPNDDTKPPSLSMFPVHLGLGATAEQQPEFTGAMEWYEGYVERHGVDGKEGRLLSMHDVNDPWDVWEMHPRGTEIVLCTAGAFTLIQDENGEIRKTRLTAGTYAINAPGVWHTADAEEGGASVVFVTAGEGTEHKPR